MRAFLAILLTFCFALPLSAQQLQTPKLKAFLNDYASLFGPMEAADIERTLSEYQREAKVQLIILTVKNTEPENINSFSERMWRINKIGEDVKFENKGALIVFSESEKNIEKKLKIIVHPEVKSRLSDSTIKGIIREKVAPRLKNGEYVNGFNNLMIEVRRALTDNSGEGDFISGEGKYILAGMALGFFLIAALFFYKKRRAISN